MSLNQILDQGPTIPAKIWSNLKVNSLESTILPDANAVEIDGIPINITSLTASNILQYNGSDWINTTLGPSGTTYNDTLTCYISNSGNDTTGDGSSGNPYLTLQKALDIGNDVLTNKFCGTYTIQILSDITISGDVDFTSANTICKRIVIRGERADVETGTMSTPAPAYWYEGFRNLQFSDSRTWLTPRKFVQIADRNSDETFKYFTSNRGALGPTINVNISITELNYVNRNSANNAIFNVSHTLTLAADNVKGADGTITFQDLIWFYPSASPQIEIAENLTLLYRNCEIIAQRSATAQHIYEGCWLRSVTSTTNLSFTKRVKNCTIDVVNGGFFIMSGITSGLDLDDVNKLLMYSVFITDTGGRVTIGSNTAEKYELMMHTCSNDNAGANISQVWLEGCFDLDANGCSFQNLDITKSTTEIGANSLIFTGCKLIRSINGPLISVVGCDVKFISCTISNTLVTALQTNSLVDIYNGTVSILRSTIDFENSAIVNSTSSSIYLEDCDYTQVNAVTAAVALLNLKDNSTLTFATPNVFVFPVDPNVRVVKLRKISQATGDTPTITAGIIHQDLATATSTSFVSPAAFADLKNYEFCVVEL